MPEDMFQPWQAQNPLQMVHDDMQVYDSSGKKIGRVKQVFFGAGTDSIDEGTGGPANTPSPLESSDENTFQTGMANAVFGDNLAPDVLRKRLEKNGFIRIDTGILSRDRFALPDQIASVDGDRVNLKVSENELIYQ